MFPAICPAPALKVATRPDLSKDRIKNRVYLEAERATFTCAKGYSYRATDPIVFYNQFTITCGDLKWDRDFTSIPKCE